MNSTRTTRKGSSGPKAAIFTAFMAAGLGSALGAHAQTAQLAVNTVGYSLSATNSIGGLIQADGIGNGSVTAATTSVAQETYATFILPTLAAGTQFDGADFSVFKTSFFNLIGGGEGVFAQPDFNGNLVAAAAPASLVPATLTGQTLQLGVDGTPITAANGDETDVTPDIDIKGQGYTDSVTGTAITSTFGDKIVTTTNSFGQSVKSVVDAAGNPVKAPNGSLFAGNPDEYHPTGYENTVTNDPLYLTTPKGEVTFATGAAGQPITSLGYQTLVSNFLTPTDYSVNGLISTGTSAAIAQFLNGAYQEYGAGSTVTFSVAPSVAADAPGTPGSAYTLVGGTESLSYTVGPAAIPAAVPEPSPLALLALGTGGLVLVARKRRAGASVA